MFDFYLYGSGVLFKNFKILFSFFLPDFEIVTSCVYLFFFNLLIYFPKLHSFADALEKPD